jgi:hypothetical protein
MLKKYPHVHAVSNMRNDFEAFKYYNMESI